MEVIDWKSPRKVEEEITLYKRERYEYYMTMADSGLMTPEDAALAYQDELDNPDAIWTPDGCGA